MFPQEDELKTKQLFRILLTTIVLASFILTACTPAATPAPTVAPTKPPAPTTAPTKAPDPTKAPTVAPTVVPTAAPIKLSIICRCVVGGTGANTAKWLL